MLRLLIHFLSSGEGKGPFEEERKLLHSSDPTEIRSLVKTLLGRLGKHNVMYLSDKVSISLNSTSVISFKKVI